MAYSPTGAGTSSSREPPRPFRREAVDVPGRERRDAAGAISATHECGEVRVHRPRQRLVGCRSELSAGHEDHVRRVGQPSEGLFVEEVAADRLDAVLFERPLRCRRGEARHANHPARQAGRVEGAARHPSQGRTHLPGDSEDDDVAFHTPHGVDRCGRRIAQQLLEVIDIANRGRDLHLRPIMSRD